MRSSPGVSVVVCMPEESPIVGRPIFLGVVDINIDDVSGEVIGKFEPAPVTTPDIMDDDPIKYIILIVIMRNQRGLASMRNRLMIGVEIPKVPPAILVNDFSPGAEGMRPLNGCFDQSRACGMRVLRAWREIVEGARLRIPVWRCLWNQALVYPTQMRP